MTYGFRVYNNNGYVQIDDNYVNYKAVQVGWAYSGQEVWFPWQPEAPFVMVHPEIIGGGVAIGMLGYGVKNSSFKIHCFTQDFNSNGYIIWRTRPDLRFKYIVFANDGPPIETSGYGMRIYDGGGRRVFTTENPPLRVDAVRSYTGMAYTGPSYIYFPDYRERYACANAHMLIGWKGFFGTNCILARFDSYAQIMIDGFAMIDYWGTAWDDPSRSEAGDLGGSNGQMINSIYGGF